MASGLVRHLALAGICAIAALWGTPAAQGGIITDTFELGDSNVALNYGPPYATLDITYDNTAGTVKFDIATPAGSGALIDELNFNTDLTLTSSDFTTIPSGWGIDGPGTPSQSIFGKFSWGVGGTGASDRMSSAEIIVTLPTAADATASHFEINNTSGFMFASHAFDSAGTGGFIGNGNQGNVVPEPASLAIWGSVGLLGLVYRRRKKHAALTTAL